MMATLARRLLSAAVRKLLPESSGSALALRSAGEIAPVRDSQSTILFPTARPSQTLYAPPLAAPAPPPRRRRKVVTETFVYEERQW